MSTIPSSPPNAMAAAMRGLRLAGDRAAEAAATVVQAALPPPAGPPAETPTLLPPAGPPAGIPPPPDMVGLKQASQAYAANAVTLRSADEMSATLLRRTA